MASFEAAPFHQEMIDSWRIALSAERKSAETIRNYMRGMRYYAAWCTEHGRQLTLERRTFEAYLADLVEEGRLSASTIALRHMAVRRFSAWLADEDEITDPLLAVKSPKLDEKVVLPLAAEELAALIAACRGVSFLDRRDEAVVRLMAESGPRASDLLSMTVAGTSVTAGTAVVMGKGSKERILGYGPQTARALDRYLRMRRTHRLATETDAFWLGENGKTFGYNGLYAAMIRRSQAAGIPGFHPHRLRHTFTDRWLDRGGSEGGLMAVAGWSSRKMVDRYSKARQAQRALDESKRLNLGEF